jgi:hypothetical protein
MTLHEYVPARLIDRRDLLHRLALTAAWSVAGVLATATLPTRVHAATQDNWRMCNKCNMMFYAGYRRSICPAGARHDAAVGANFILPYDVGETANAQGAWRFCNKCESLFFDGYPDKGVCARGGGHVAQGFVFVLPHDIRAGGYVEKDWRYCTKCHAIFSNLSGRVGRCAAGAGHAAAGFNFALRFRGNLEGDNVGIPANN